MFAKKPAHWNVNNIFINNKGKKRLMIIFKTLPCSKIAKQGRCLTCGFDYHSRDVEGYDLVAQFNSIRKIIIKKKIEHIDLLSSGSILDKKQVNYPQVIRLIKEITKLGSVTSLLIEGRVEHCDLRKIKEIKKRLKGIELEYGIGLECYSDKIRNHILNKNLKLKDYILCIKKLQKLQISISTYILMGIPSLNKKKMLDETINSIIQVVNLYQKYGCKGRIDLYPVFVTPNTILENLYKTKKYRLIQIKDIIHVLLEVNKKIDLKQYPIFVGLDDEGISDNRYVGFDENKKLNDIIEKFNLTQNVELF